MREIARGFINLLRFGGRDSPGQFWPFAGFILIVSFLAFGVAVFADTRTDIHAFGQAQIVHLSAIALLLAAAITRRLHDRGLSGALALAPVALMMVTLYTQWQMREALDGAVAAGSLFRLDLHGILVAWGPIALHSLALGLLIIVLAMPGRPVANRYGPPPQ